MAKRDRAVSLSQDWKSIVKDEEETKKMRDQYKLDGLKEQDRQEVKLCTTSVYSGKWNALGMAGTGIYTFPYEFIGCEYNGFFEDGMFHGEGEMTYPMGQKLATIFDKGKMIAYRFCNVDGLDYDEEWEYCTMPDRRFNVSMREGLQPPGREFMTNRQPERTIEPGCYDTCDGVYDPKARCITAISDIEEPEETEDEKINETDNEFWIRSLTMVSQERHEWILQHCRKAADDPVGYRPEFYEDWISGRRSELEALEKKYKDPKGNTDFDEMEENFLDNVPHPSKPKKMSYIKD